MGGCFGRLEYSFSTIPHYRMLHSENQSLGTDDENLENRKEKETLKESKRKPWLAIMQLCIVLAFVVGISLVALNKNARKTFLNACDSFRELSGGELIYLTIFTFLVVAFVPSTFFEIVCAYLYGFWIGLVINSASKLLGSLVSFSFGRYCCKVKVRKWARGYSIFSAFEKSMAESWKLLFLFRLGYFPMGLKNYGLSVVKDLTYFRFLVVVVLSGIPFTVMFTLTGSSFKDLTEALDGEEMDPSRIAFLVVALACTFVLIFVLLWKVRRMNSTLAAETADPVESDKLELAVADKYLEEKKTAEVSIR